jgi:nitroimidazol reductase NimA-like FMN-containing flavoprotein (pyridoxamine 5'-phosphate oxidase superfamily)
MSSTVPAAGLSHVTESAPPGHDLEVLTEDQCIDMLASRKLGRIAFSVADRIEIFPVNYATDRAIVVFRTAPGTKLDTVTTSRVAFEVDDWDEDQWIGWSVVLKGVAQEVTTGTDPFAATLRTRNVWPLAPGQRDHWIAIYPSEISGRRFRRG